MNINMKKYNNPVCNIVRLGNDIIATSDEHNVMGNCLQLTGERRSMDEDYEVY